MTLDAVVGKVERVADGCNLLENLGFLEDIWTWQTSQEVFADWQKGAPVEGVNTANMGIYRLVNDEVVFDLLGRGGNPFVDERFQEEAYHGIVGNEFFSPQAAMKEHILVAINTGASVSVRYSGLRIKTENCRKMYGYVEVGGENTNEEKRLFTAVYGLENPGEGKKVYLLREQVVKSQLADRGDDLIARACYFIYLHYFIAYDWGINDYFGAVRGVRRGSVAEGDAQKVPGAPQEIDNVRRAYGLLNEVSPEEAAQRLQPGDAANLAAIVAAYTRIQAGQ